MPSQLPVPVDLTEKQKAFVEAYVQLGGKHAGRAARLAGYTDSAADAIASRLLRRQDVLAYMRWIAQSKIEADVLVSADTLRQLRDDVTVAADIRRKCASELLSRAGLILEKVTVLKDERTPSLPELLAKAKSLSAKLGLPLDLSKMGYSAERMKEIERGAPVIVDASFEEVEPERAPPVVITGAEGLEDLIGADPR